MGNDCQEGDWTQRLRERYAPWLDDLSYGIECRDGWRSLIEATLESLIAAVGSPAECTDLRLTRIRQKFGWLVCQHEGLLGEQALAVDRVLARALACSSEACEVCGRPGRQREEDVAEDLWVVLCDECREGGLW
jgi:hypothetical protein